MLTLIALAAVAATPVSGRVDRLLDAIQKVETGGQLNGGRDARGDRNGASLGPMQIQYAYWRDSGVPGRYEQVCIRAYSRRVVVAYWRRYFPGALAKGDLETLARGHNGGPRGPQMKATIPYWHKVRKEMSR